jgi:hypothetical protein
LILRTSENSSFSTRLGELRTMSQGDSTLRTERLVRGESKAHILRL